MAPDSGLGPESEIFWKKTGTEKSGMVNVDRYVLTHSKALTIPLLHFRKGTGSGRVLFWFTLDGKARSKDWPKLKSTSIWITR